MIGRRTIAALSLLCALMFCALAAQGASAAEAINTTAFTCVEGGGKLDFADAHCDETVTAGKGKFGHEPLTNTDELGRTDIHVTNEKTAEKTTKSTNATFKGELLAAKVHLECTKVTTDPGTTSFIRNSGTGTEHKVDGTVAVIFEGCTVKEPANCSIKKITTASTFVGWEEGGKMGLEFKGDGSEIFATFTLEGEKCALKTTAIQVIGTAIGTGTPGATAKESGATINFANTEEMQKLEIKGSKKPAEFLGSFTTNMVKENEKKEQITESPISLTTPTTP